MLMQYNQNFDMIAYKLVWFWLTFSSYTLKVSRKIQFLQEKLFDKNMSQCSVRIRRISSCVGEILDPVRLNRDLSRVEWDRYIKTERRKQVALLNTLRRVWWEKLFYLDEILLIKERIKRKWTSYPFFLLK